MGICLLFGFFFLNNNDTFMILSSLDKYLFLIYPVPGRGVTNTEKILPLPLKSELSTSSRLISLNEK